MEETLLTKLREDETLLWSTKPESFETLDAVYKTPIIRKIIIIVACIAVLSAWYISAAIANGVAVQPVAILICSSPFLYSIWNDFSDAKKLKNDVVYGLTDRRMLTLNGKQLASLEYDKIPCYDLVTDAAGHVSLVCGADAVKGKEKSRREAAVCGVRMNIDTDMCESYVMYGITADAQQVKDILSKYIAA